MSAVPEVKRDTETARYARAYIERYGMSIVPIPPKKKRPLHENWGLTEVISDPDEAAAYFNKHPNDNMGCVLGPSRICSFDVDNLEAVQIIFDEFGWDIEALRTQNPTIQGSPKGFRVMFAVPDGIELKYHELTWPRQDDPSKLFTVFELRAVDDGQQRQDVLPPSIHPVTQSPYVWLVKPNGHFPTPPDFLVKLWQNWDALKPQLKALCPWAPAPVVRPLRARREHSGDSVIDAFNDAHDLESCLTRYGYKRQGRRYLSPHSGTGLPGVTVFDDNRCFIHHASDPLCSVESNQPVAPFDLFRTYEHGGDITSAVRAAAAMLGMKFEPARPVSALPVADIKRINPEPEPPTEPPPEQPKTIIPRNIFEEMHAPAIQADMLPEAIWDYSQDCAELLGADPAMIAIPAIVACAAALHDGVQIQPKRHETGWTESARLWCAIVGSPSVKKSPAMSRATKRLRKINADLGENNAKLSAQYNEQADQYKTEKRNAQKNGDPTPTAPERPALTRLMVEDITVESLSEVLKDNPRGVLCMHDELSGWFGSMDAYSGGKTGNKDRAAWLQAYNGGFRLVDRISRGAVSIPNFSVSMIGGIQPDAIRRIAQDMTDDGLMQRFMIVIGKNRAEHDRPENSEAYRRYSSLVDHLYAVQPSQNTVKLSDEAHAVREAVRSFSENMADYSVLPGGLRSHMGKWTGLFARLCLVYHAIDCAAENIHPAAQPVSGDTAKRVQRLMEYFLFNHALSYYTDILGATSEIEHARWVAEWILSKSLNDFTSRDVNRAYKQWRGMDQFRRVRVMQFLEDAGWITAYDEDGKRAPRGGSVWVVTPSVHAEFAHLVESASESRAARYRLVSERQSRARGDDKGDMDDNGDIR